MSQGLAIRTDLQNGMGLRALARRTTDQRAATRMLAVANAMEGISRAKAARLAGLERQALRGCSIVPNPVGRRP
jgi:hypothetical protein